jgi:hypothetical protein
MDISLPLAFAWRWLGALSLCLCMCSPARALLAGASPDTPTARVDPNIATSPWGGVGSVVVNGQTFSGTVIAPHYVLTAGHVGAGATPDNTHFNLNVTGSVSHAMAVAAVFVPPGYNGFDPLHPAGDLALLRLVEAVPAGIPIYDIWRAPLRVGTILTLVGYGASGNGDVGVTTDPNPTIKRVGRNVVDHFVKDAATGKAAIYYFDFDGPDLASNKMGEGTLGNADETTVAGGDSGGPAFFIDKYGHPWLAGVNTFWTPLDSGLGPGRFGTGGGGMLLSSYLPWIKSVISVTRKRRFVAPPAASAALPPSR